MRLSDLRDKRIKTEDGKTLGRVHDVHCERGRVIGLTAGPGSFLERLTAKNNGRRIPWEAVKRVEPTAIIVMAAPPKRRSSGAKQARISRKRAVSTTKGRTRRR